MTPNSSESEDDEIKMEPTAITEIDVIPLMQRRLPKYVANCLQAAGYDEQEVIATMDTSEGEKNSISKIEKYIEIHHKINPDMLPNSLSSLPSSITALPFEFPPGHRIRICNFVQEVKQACRNTVSTINNRSSTIIAQTKNQITLSADEINSQVCENITKWIKQQKKITLNSLKNGKHYSVDVNETSKGHFSVHIRCILCHTSIRLQQFKGSTRYQISNWCRHVKMCPINNTNCKQKKLSQLFHKASPPAADHENNGSLELSDSVNENHSSDSVFPTPLDTNKLDSQNDSNKSSSNSQVF